MKMNAEPPEFESLQRLLKLKRHEQPPPRFFNEFSGQVIQRLRTSRSGSRQDDRENVGPAWLQRIFAAFQDGRVLAGACGAGVLALLLGGGMYTGNSGSEPTTVRFGGLEAQAMFPAAPELRAVSPLAATGTNTDSSLSGSSLFDIGLKPQPISWRPTGR